MPSPIEARSQRPSLYLAILVFTAGAVTLGMELSASRLLEPVFGNNQIVWAALIGLILLYLATGAWLGGRLADRFPRRRELDLTMCLAGIGVAVVPILSGPVLRLAATGMDTFAAGLLAGSLLAVLLLFGIPGVLLGVASPWAVRLSVRDLAQTGHVAGHLSAIATIGSLLGTFLPILWLIPAFGTRWTFLILAMVLLVVVAAGSLRQPHRWAPLLALAVVLALALLAQPGSSVRGAWDSGADGELIYEDESVYNYIAVRQWGTERHLKLNDGIGLHSVYHPDSVLSLGIWDYFLLAPLFNPPPALADASDNLLLIGLAAGTVSELYTDIYGPMPITGVELDPQIIEVGQQYFEMNQPNLTAVAADGRHWLAQQPADAAWSIIAVDAYRPPYIPFHLTTVEFFRQVHSHLKPDGILAINVGRTDTNFDLVNAMAATVAQVFPSVYLVDEPGPPATLANSLLVATVQPVALENLSANVAALPDTMPVEFREFATQSLAYARQPAPPEGTPIFTDDHAPVERVVHAIIVEYMLGR
jgi:predicted membrane-bound spermidine synthase